MLKTLDGLKTYALGVVTIAIGVLELVGVDVVPNIDASNATTTIMAGFGILFARSALKKAEV